MAPPTAPIAGLPLRGDGCGKYRVHVVGNSGAHQTSLAVLLLGGILGVPHIALDALFWKPGWEKSSTPEFQTKLRALLDANPRGWVVDGNYTKRVDDILESEQTDVIWLDPPLFLYFPRLCLRTLWRLLRVQEQCAADCPERFGRTFFSRDSIIWWCITQHSASRRIYGPRLLTDGIHVGGKMRRIGGCGNELKEWKEDVREMARSQ
ncbi:hypothetical protein BC834DRAFT_822774 [Gloeopeniophorella convolvens]|nr:hypothetical protein BC834DRAFT_822774 [Gloeopeniophorella convolvens]